MKLEFSRNIFGKHSNIKFHDNLSSGSRVVSCGQTDMKKLIVVFRNFADAPNNAEEVQISITTGEVGHNLAFSNNKRCL